MRVMTVTALDFLGIPTQDADRARTFYRDALPMRYLFAPICVPRSR